MRLSAGSGVRARDLLATRFLGGAIRAGTRTVLLFENSESSVTSALLHRNGFRQLRGGIQDGVVFLSLDPKLRDAHWVANPDPRSRADSPALSERAEGYIGALGEDANWLNEWTVFGSEPDYNTRNTEYNTGRVQC